MRDELAGWANNAGKPFSKDTAAANVGLLLQRLVHLGSFAHCDKVGNPLPSHALTLYSLTLAPKQQQADDVNKRVSQLLEAATDPNKLAAMDPTWLPPF
jgi:hypothetical protein